MPSNVVKRVLRAVNDADRKVINEILNYPEDCAGSIMTTEFIDLKDDMTVDQAFAKIKKIGLTTETVYNCYVVDKNSSSQIVLEQLNKDYNVLGMNIDTS